MEHENFSVDDLKKKIEELEANLNQISQSQSIYKAIFEKIPIGIEVFDKNGYSILINEAQKVILGLPNRNEKIGQFNILTDPFTLNNRRNEIYHRVYQGNEYQHEFEYDFSKIKSKWNDRQDCRIISENIFPVKDENDNVKFAVSILNDITETQDKNNLINAQLKDYQDINHELGKALDKANAIETQFRLLFDNAPEPIFILVDTKFEYINKATLDLYGAKSENELIGTKAIDRVHTDFIPVVLQRLNTLTSNSQKVDSHELKHYRLDGSVIDVEVSAISILFNQKNSVLVFIKDISERKQNEQKIIGLSNVIKKSLNEIYIFDKQTLQFKFLNNSALNNLGYTINEALQLTPLDIKPFITKDDFYKIINPLITNEKELIIFETIHRRKNQTDYPVSVNLQINEFEGTDCFIAIINDITEQKQIQDEIKLRNEEVEHFFESAIDLMCIANTDGYFVRLNHQWEIVLGYSLQELYSRRFLEFVHPDDLQVTMDAIKQLSEQKCVINLENRYQCKNGDYKWIEWKSVPHGSRIYAAARDITENKMFQQALMNKNMELESSEEEIRAANEELVATSDALKETNLELQLAKKMVEQNEAQLIEAQRIAKLGSWNLDLKNNILSWSKASYTIFNIDEALSGSALQPALYSLIVADDVEKLENCIQDAIKQKKVFSIDFRVSVNETEKNIQMIGEPIIDNESVIAFQGSLQDITERFQYEQKLSESYHLLKSLTAQVPGVVYLYRLYPDGHSAFPFSSIGMYEIYEVTSDQVREDATLVFSRIHPDDYDYIVETITESAQNQTLYQSDFRVVLPKQGLRWRHCEAKPQRLDDGSTLWYGIITDITERKITDEKLKEQQLLFETMFNTITDGVIITDTDRNILLANNGIKSTFGYHHDEIIGKSAKILYADKEKYDKAGVEIYNEYTLSPGSLYQTKYRDKNNMVFPGETFGAKLYNSNGTWIGNLAIMRNISERVKYINDLKNALEKAEESDRLKTAFLHNISHEIRTPMNAIIGFSELLNNQGLVPQKRQHFTEMISYSSNQLLSIINDIITIATIEAGQEKAIENQVKLNALLDNLYTQFAVKAQKQNIQFNLITQLPENHDLILSDKSKLETIISSLINNALKFTHQGSVEFGYNIDHDSLLFFVKDTGIGIDPAFHTVIFDCFRQVETTSTRLYSGSGLGLSISKAYVELLGGKIWVESEPNIGSTFYFSIPYKKAAKANEYLQQLKNPVETRTQPVNILIAEDEDTNFIVLEEWLSEVGIQVTRAFNGLEAVDYCKNNNPIDLILMDIKMPVMDGLEATRQIKTMKPNLPIVAQTAYSFAEERQQAFLAGCDLFITKPINREELLKTINQLLNKSKTD